MQHYLVIGSGLIGRLLAWRLLVTGGSLVDILSSDDKKGTQSAGYAAAAMIAPSTEAATTSPLVQKIGLASLHLWPQWLAELPEKIFYQNHGTLVVAHAGDSVEMARFKKRAEHTLKADDFSYLSKDELKEAEPQLARQFDSALYFSEEGCLDNHHFYHQLSLILAKHCNWQQCTSIKHLTEDSIDILCHQHFGHNADKYDAVIDCRGNGAKHDIKELRGVRGEIIRVHAPEVDFHHVIRLMHPRYPLYLAPRANNQYVLGATVIESDDMSPISVRSGLELMSALYSIHKGFAEARVIDMTTHCRPALADNMPSIKRVAWGYQINGFYRHGYLFSPAIISDFLRILNNQTDQLMFGDCYAL